MWWVASEFLKHEQVLKYAHLLVQELTQFDDEGVTRSATRLASAHAHSCESELKKNNWVIFSVFAFAQNVGGGGCGTNKLCA
jgi:hypothetical protein